MNIDRFKHLINVALAVVNGLNPILEEHDINISSVNIDVRLDKISIDAEHVEIHVNVGEGKYDVYVEAKSKSVIISKNSLNILIKIFVAVENSLREVKDSGKR